MGERIYIMDGETLAPLEEQPFAQEEKLQKLIAEHPELLDGAQITPHNPRRWMLVTREMGIAAEPGGADWWALDHLFVDQDATPTLVEVKRSANSEIRRTIVGQMLDYAAHGVRAWTVDRLRNTFTQTCEDSGKEPNAELRELLGEDEPDGDAFWEEVARNLAAKRLRLLFVADGIPDELLRVVEFLNEQLRDIEVLAVEIKQFTNGSRQMLAPSVMGRTAAAPGKTGPRRTRTKVTHESFMEQLPSDAAREATKRLFSVAREHGAYLYYGDKGISIRIQLRKDVWQDVRPWPVTVAWLFPPSDSSFWMGLWGFSFGTGILMYDNPRPSTKLRGVLKTWVNQFASDGFGENKLEGDDQHVWARAVSHDDVVENIDLLADRLANVLDDLSKLQAADSSL